MKKVKALTIIIIIIAIMIKINTYDEEGICRSMDEKDLIIEKMR